MLMCMASKYKYLFFLFADSLTHAAIVWPTSELEWKALTTNNGTSLYQDPAGDSSPSSSDIVGNSTYAAAFWFYQNNGTSSINDDQLLFRIRIEDQPNNPQGTWQIIFNTDSDDGIDFALEYDASGSPDIIELVTTIDEGPTLGDVTFDTMTPPWSSTAISDFTRWINPTGDGSDLGGDGGDAFLDLGIPWTDFSTVTGIAIDQPFQVGATSGTPNQINKDIPLGETTSSPVTVILADTIVAVPEPRGIALLILGGWFLLAKRSRY